MFERLRRALVESFIGAIGLGYLFAQGIMHFVNVFSSPVAHWINGNELHRLMPRETGSQSFQFQYALSELVDFILLMTVWYILIRWLYFKPLKEQPSGPDLPKGELGPSENPQ